MAQIIVGIGECRVSTDPSDVLVTHALGSCIGIVLHDPVTKVAGLLHYMLPDSRLDPDSASIRPFMFADTGIPLLLQSALQLGAVKSRLIVMVAGGAQIVDPRGVFNIGQQNYDAMRTELCKAGVLVNAEETGGSSSRTIRITVSNGQVLIRTSAGPLREMRINPRKNGAGDGLQHD